MIHLGWLLLTASVGDVLGHAHDQSNLHDGNFNSFSVPRYLFPTLLNDHELTTLLLPTWTRLHANLNTSYVKYPPAKPQLPMSVHASLP
jgi:hypothetical protein